MAPRGDGVLDRRVNVGVTARGNVRTTTVRRELEKASEKAVEEVARATVRQIKAKGGVKAAAKAAAASASRFLTRTPIATPKLVAAGKATVGLIPAAILAALAGSISYSLTKKVLEEIAKRRDPAWRKQQIALKYRAARIEAARRLGRELSSEEHKVLADQFKAAIAAAGGLP